MERDLNDRDTEQRLIEQDIAAKVASLPEADLQAGLRIQQMMADDETLWPEMRTWCRRYARAIAARIESLQPAKAA